MKRTCCITAPKGLIIISNMEFHTTLNLKIITV